MPSGGFVGCAARGKDDVQLRFTGVTCRFKGHVNTSSSSSRRRQTRTKAAPRTNSYQLRTELGTAARRIDASRLTN